MKVSRFTIVCLALTFACACSSRASSSKIESAPEKTPPEIEAVLPTINGLPVSDLPIADPNLEEAWIEGQRLLELKPPSLDESANAKEVASWFGNFLDWTRLFFAQRHALIKKFGTMQGSDRVNLFSNMLFANIDARFIDGLEAINLPATLSKESRTYVQNSIGLKISVLIEAVISEFRAVQKGLQNAHASLEGWKTVSEKENLRFSKTRKNYDKKSLAKKTRFKMGLSDKWPTECETKSAVQYRQYSGLRNESSKRQRLAVLVDENDFEKVFKDDPKAFASFQQTLYKSLSKMQKKAKLIPLKEIESAKNLVLEKKLSKNSNTCAAAPPIEAVLQEKYKNLVVANVTKTNLVSLCSSWDGSTQKMVKKEGCTEDRSYQLSIVVRPYGPNKNFNTLRREGNIRAKDVNQPSAWIAAAKKLEVTRTVSVFGALSDVVTFPDNARARVWKRFYDKGYQDAWFEKTKTLNDNKAFHACNLATSPITYDLDWSVSVEGKSEDVKLTWVNEPVAESQTIKACMEKVLSETPWRCPRVTTPQKLSSRVCERKSFKWWD